MWELLVVATSALTHRDARAGQHMETADVLLSPSPLNFSKF